MKLAKKERQGSKMSSDERAEPHGKDGAMKDEDYPGLFHRADQASMHAQKVFLRLERGRLGLLILGSLFPILYVLDESWSKALDGTVVIVLIVIVVLAWVAKAREDDKKWFDCRAVAESAKAATWRYMMKMPPYEHSQSDDRFVASLNEIRTARPSVSSPLARQSVRDGSSITDFMRSTRASTFEERKEFYVEARLRGQKDWYRWKAKENSDLNECAFWTFIALQVVAVAAAIGKFAGLLTVSMVPVLMTGAAALIAWGETKRYRELGESYSMAHEELEGQESMAVGRAEEAAFPRVH